MSDDTPSPLNNVITIDDEGRFPRVDDSAALSSRVELCQALTTKPTTQKLAAGAPSKLPTARITWPGRSDLVRCAPNKMCSRASPSLALERISAERSRC